MSLVTSDAKYELAAHHFLRGILMLNKLSGFDQLADYARQVVHEIGYTAAKTVLKPVLRMAFCNPVKAEVFNPFDKLVSTHYAYNGIVDQGMHSLLDIFFRNQTQITTWFMGLIDGAGSQSLSDSDVAGTHAGWTENTSFTGGPSRKDWTAALAAAAARSISNSTTLDYAFTTTQTIHGIFMIDDVTADTGAEVLWSTAPFSTEVTVNNGDTLKVTYTVSG